MRVGHGDNFHDVAVFQLGAQWHLFAVDLACDGAIADVRMHGIRKVDYRRAAWQRHDLALGREHVDGIREQVDSDMVPELRRVARFVLDVEQRLQPLGAHAFDGGCARAAHFLVEPVRGNARLGHYVHFFGPDLELDVHAGRADQRRVQGLIAVGLGDRNMVLELAGNRFVHLVQHTERRIAVGGGRYDHAETVDVRDLSKAQMLDRHLLVDREHGLFAPGQAHIHAHTAECQIHLALHLGDQVTASAPGLVDGLGERRVAPGMQMAEGQILQLAEGLVQTEAMGDGYVNFQRFRRDAAPLGARHVGQRAHVVRAVGQLDQNDAHVARHRQEHFSERLGLVFFAGVELQLVELGQSIDHFGHRCTEALDQIGLGDSAVFHRVVQQCGTQRLGIQLPAGAQPRHRDGVGDVGLAAAAHLAQMGLVGIAIGLAHLLDAGVVQIVQLLQKRSKTSRRRIGRCRACASRRFLLGRITDV